jgi:hypothetical protein
MLLDAGNPGSDYYWSNGATTQSIEVGTTGIGYDMQSYRVRVLNEYGCVDSADSRVFFSFSACEGIEDLLPEGSFTVYPNPGNGKIHLEIKYHGQDLDVEITTMMGEVVLNDKISFYGGGFPGRDYDLSQLPKGLYIINLKNDRFFRMVKFINR